MKRSALAAAIGLSLSLVGCATNKPATFDPEHSRAYNIARAGGLHEVKDKEIPKADYEALDTAMAAAGNTLALTSGAGFGLSLGKGLGVGLLVSMLEPEGTAERSSLIAWMPADQASSTKDAQAKMLSHVGNAMAQTLTEMNIEVLGPYEGDYWVSYAAVSEKYGCPTEAEVESTGKDMCIIFTRIYEPDEGSSPQFGPGNGTPAFAFTSEHDTKYHRVTIKNGDTGRIPQDIFYTKLSERLPAWAYLYQAPGKVVKEDGEAIKFPHLLEKGQVELFVYPSK